MTANDIQDKTVRKHLHRLGHGMPKPPTSLVIEGILLEGEDTINDVNLIGAVAGARYLSSMVDDLGPKPVRIVKTPSSIRIEWKASDLSCDYAGPRAKRHAGYMEQLYSRLPVELVEAASDDN